MLIISGACRETGGGAVIKITDPPHRHLRPAPTLIRTRPLTPRSPLAPRSPALVGAIVGRLPFRAVTSDFNAPPAKELRARERNDRESAERGHEKGPEVLRCKALFLSTARTIAPRYKSRIIARSRRCYDVALLVSFRLNE